MASEKMSFPGQPPANGPIMNSKMANESRAVELLTAMWTLTGVAMVTLILRLFSKHKQDVKHYWDDVILWASFLCVVMQSICATMGVKYGLGTHVATIPSENVVPILLWMHIPPVFAVLGASLSKTAYAVLLMRLTKYRPWMKRVLWTAVISMNLLMGMAGLLNWVQCQPMEKAWNPAIPGNCWDRKLQVIWGVGASVYSGIMDLLFAVMPWILIHDLRQKTRKERLELGAAMSLGVVASASAFIKSVYIPLLEESDFTWEGIDLIIWAVVETVVTIIAASAPVLRAMIRDANNRVYDPSKQQLPSLPAIVRRWTIGVGPTNATLTGGGGGGRRGSLKEKYSYNSGMRKNSQDTLVAGDGGEKGSAGGGGERTIRIREVPHEV